MELEKLYSLDSKDKIRVWYIEVDGVNYRTVSGILDGQLVTSSWTEAKPKNVGKSNKTTGEEQALLEANALYKKKEDKKYFRSVEEITGKSKIFAPMLAEKYKCYDETMYYSQPKLDGIRCVFTKDGAFSREGKPFFTVEHITKSLKEFFIKYPNVVLDGELYNHQLKDNFNSLVSFIKKQKPTEDELIVIRKKVQYHIYDFGDVNVLFHDRWKLLFEELSDNEIIHLVPTSLIRSGSHLNELFTEYLENGYEGQMIRYNTPYENKRSKGLLKRKTFEDKEFPVLSYEYGEGNWSDCPKVLQCEIDGKPFKATIKGSKEEIQELFKQGRPTQATVRYQNLTPDGIPRFPIAVALYWGERDI